MESIFGIMVEPIEFERNRVSRSYWFPQVQFSEFRLIHYCIWVNLRFYMNEHAPKTHKPFRIWQRYLEQCCSPCYFLKFPRLHLPKITMSWLSISVKCRTIAFIVILFKFLSFVIVTGYYINGVSSMQILFVFGTT